MAGRHSIWTKIGGVLSGVAAFVTAVTGLYLAFRGEPTPVSPSPTPISTDVTPSESLRGNVYERTPWLGLELRQQNQLVELRSSDDSWSQFEATLAAEPFELTVTRTADDPAIGILAWQDDSIFDCVRGDQFFIPGTGIAGAKFAVPILYFDKEGFNYYHTERLKRIADDRYSIFVSTIGMRDLELPLTRFKGPIYLVVFRVPEEFDIVVSRHNFELFTLRRK